MDAWEFVLIICMLLFTTVLCHGMIAITMDTIVIDKTVLIQNNKTIIEKPIINNTIQKVDIDGKCWSVIDAEDHVMLRCYNNG